MILRGNALEMILLFKKRTGNDFIIKMHWKCFYVEIHCNYQNLLQIILSKKASQKILL